MKNKSKYIKILLLVVMAPILWATAKTHPVERPAAKTGHVSFLPGKS